ncbi:N2,N2-dimethylguanosine tRNA methyltransferase [Pneumocystis carinii B80]|uniref:tRNA (guanine(26)-N(2))-dimethyltransferase n=1 Tax=Pneumocystis carinii (strain B80) TaxID=1408658 RepID=A0A0W4ZBK4_PNEC8|nr:N2,N2-dimethylguanosine tRNA methyltransferase [Pneumocystis carinii B80]KTW25646.1 N2,N2-dimethylguanosine tRNA methyltransferase [Pneumocystis carinii B80]
MIIVEKEGKEGSDRGSEGYKININDEKKVLKDINKFNFMNKQQEICLAKFNILDAFSATGIRAIRYIKEIENVEYVVANDNAKTSIDMIKKNSMYNDVFEKVKPSHEDARFIMYKHVIQRKYFDVIDLDPYGTASPFIDGAVQCISDGGLLCVTCTDLAVLAGGGYPEKCFSNYGSMPFRHSVFCHEQALRIVLHTISSSCARYGRYITPLLSIYSDFYIRLFVKIETSPYNVKFLHNNIMMSYLCSGCYTFYNQPIGKTSPSKNLNTYKHFNSQGPIVNPNCEFCGFKLHISGPMWSGPLHDKEFVKSALNILESESIDIYETLPRMKKLFLIIEDELVNPFYYSPAHLSKILHCQTPPLKDVVSALINSGYLVSLTHASPGCIKTNASPRILWDIMKSWIKQCPVNKEHIRDGTAGKEILKSDPDTCISFLFHPDINKIFKSGLVKCHLNPTKKSGPKAKAKVRANEDENPA